MFSSFLLLFIFFLLFPLNECKLMSVEKRKLRYKRRQRKEGKAREGQAERGAMVEGVAWLTQERRQREEGRPREKWVSMGLSGGRERSGDRESRELYKEVGDSEEGASPREQQELSQERRPRESVWPRVQNIRLT